VAAGRHCRLQRWSHGVSPAGRCEKDAGESSSAHATDRWHCTGKRKRLRSNLWRFRFLRLSSDVSPILPAHIVINLGRSAASIQRVLAIALRAGNPKGVACLHVLVIVLKASDAPKAATLIVNGAARLRE